MKVFDTISCHPVSRLFLISAKFNSLLIWCHPPALQLMVLHMVRNIIIWCFINTSLQVLDTKVMVQPCFLIAAQGEGSWQWGIMDAKAFYEPDERRSASQKRHQLKVINRDSPYPNRKSPCQKAGTAWNSACCCISKRNGKCLWTFQEEEH